MENSEEIKRQHESVFDEIVTNNQYQVYESDLKDKVVIDVGANNGVFTLLANDYGARKVIAIESNPAAADLIRKNVTNIRRDIVVLNKAASSSSNKKVKVGKDSNFGDIDGRCYVIQSDDGDIETVSVDDLISETTGEVVLKIDCEGSEYDILYSIKPENFKKISRILLEAHEGIGSAPKGVEHIDKLSYYIQNHGFKITHHDNYVGESVQLFKFEKDVNFKDDITVLISCFVRPEYLKPQIEALTNQTIKPDKIIVLYTKPYKEFQIPFVDGVDFIVVENDQGLNARFAVGLVAKTRYVCIMDDDLIPGRKWLETCLEAIKRENAIICGYGVKYNEAWDENNSKKFGDHGDKNEALEAVDMAGHSWFMNKEWLKYFWMEEPLDWTISDDMHLSYTIKKYTKIKLLVSPHPENNKELWSNTRPDLGLGSKALHVRENSDVLKDVANSVNESTPGLRNRFMRFLDKRRVLLEKYNKLRDNKVSTVVNSPISTIAPSSSTLPDVTCVICTKDRYFSTLHHTILALCHQTHRPKYLFIYDDSKNKKDVRGDFIYQNIFALLSFYGINWEVIWTDEEGQVANHIKSVEKSPTEMIYRIDDDEIPEPTVIEKLLRSMGPDVGAVGGLVMPSTDIKRLPFLASNKMEDIYLMLNEQWYLHPNNAPVKEVDHLYSSFIYRKSVAEYSTDLSVVGHREETILTHNIKKKGYRVLLDPAVKTWHWRNPEGGIRTANDASMFSRDERVFQKKMIEWGVNVNEYAYVVLDSGIGDHYAFKSILNLYLSKHKNDKKVFFTAHPLIFIDGQNSLEFRQASIHDAKEMFGNIDKYNIYKWMIEHNWRKGLPEALAKMYNLDYTPKVKAERNPDTIKDFIIVSPYSYFPGHAKSYPYWNELIPKIKTLGYKIIQIGKRGEEPLKDVDDYWWNPSFAYLEDRVKECKCWISVDNFLQHLANSLDVLVKGIVMWGPSDPDLFGYSYNTNILKDKKYLRPDQFGLWKNVRQDEKTKQDVEIFLPQNKDAYVRPEEVFKIIGKVVGANNG